MDNPTKIVNKPAGPVDPNKTKIEGKKAVGPGTQPADLAPKPPKSAHSQHDPGLATKEGRAARIQEINAEAAKNMRPQITQGSDELKAGIKNLKPPSIMDRLKNFSSKAAGAMGKMKTDMKNNRAMKQINTSIAQKNSMASAKPKMPNTNAGVQTGIQTKVQGAHPMGGVNMAKNVDEMLDLLKGQFSKLGKPGLSEKMGQETKAWVDANKNHPMVQRASQPPPHASKLPASTPVGTPAAAKPQAPHVAHAHAHVESMAHHNKISENISRVKAPVVPPIPLAHPQPQDHAVKSPENIAHFKQQAAGLPSTKPKNVIPRAEAEKRQFETEKTAPHQQPKAQGDGWSKPKDESTAEVTQKQSPETEKTVKTKYADISDPATFSPEKTEGDTSKAKFTDENPKAATVSHGSESKPSTVPLAGRNAQPQSGGVAKPEATPKTVQLKPNGQPPPAGTGPKPVANPAQSQPAQVAPGKAPQALAAQDRHFGVKKPVHPQEAHSHLLHFLHQLVNPGQHSADMNASKHFMHKSEKPEATAKETVGQTAIKIKAGAKKESPKKQAELLTDPNNHPEHNRKKILQMVKNCGKMNHED